MQTSSRVAYNNSQANFIIFPTSGTYFAVSNIPADTLRNGSEINWKFQNEIRTNGEGIFQNNVEPFLVASSYRQNGSSLRIGNGRNSADIGKIEKAFGETHIQFKLAVPYDRNSKLGYDTYHPTLAYGSRVFVDPEDPTNLTEAVFVVLGEDPFDCLERITNLPANFTDEGGFTKVFEHDTGTIGVCRPDGKPYPTNYELYVHGKLTGFTYQTLIFNCGYCVRRLIDALNKKSEMNGIDQKTLEENWMHYVCSNKYTDKDMDISFWWDKNNGLPQVSSIEEGPFAQACKDVSPNGIIGKYIQNDKLIFIISEEMAIVSHETNNRRKKEMFLVMAGYPYMQMPISSEQGMACFLQGKRDRVKLKTHEEKLKKAFIEFVERVRSREAETPHDSMAAPIETPRVVTPASL